MKEITIDGVTYIPIISDMNLNQDLSKCVGCVADSLTDEPTELCLKLPDCLAGSFSCHFVAKPEE